MRKHLLAALATSALLLALPAGASAATITPNTTFDETLTGGTCSLREAVQSANTDTDMGGCTHSGTYGADTIKLAGGEYDLTLKGAENANASGDLDVTHSLTITGLGADATGIDGNGTITGDRVLDVLHSGTALSLSDVAVHDGAVSAANGGGIRAASGTTLKLTSSTVSGNSATPNATGGGIEAAGTLTLISSTVSDNLAVGGGGIEAAGTVTLTKSTVSGNVASSYFGGGIYAAGTLTLISSTVSGNHAGDAGGGIYAAAGGSLTSSSVRRNVSAGNGGGILATGSGDLAVSRSMIAGNDTTGTSHQGGGIYFTSPGTLRLTNSTLSGNEATGWGGGLSSANGANSTVDLQNATVNRNTADSDSDGTGDGGGIDQPPFVTVNLKNTIVAGNLDTGGQEPDCNGNLGGGIHSQGYNLFGTTTGCGVTLTTGDQNLAGADPLVAQLGQNGGPTLTSALLAASPAVNAGNPATPGSGGDACASTDQRGVPRSLGGRCDIGAYERVSCHGVLVNVVGTSGADTLSGTSAADGVLGLGGNDTLSGGSGNDGLCGGSGNDKLSGGADNDHLDGGPGTDSCDGGPGTDTATACETTTNVP